MELDFSGKSWQGLRAGRRGHRSSYSISAPVHRLVPEAHCVLHTHMPYATALGMLEDARLEMAGQSAIGFHDAIACVDYNGLRARRLRRRRAWRGRSRWQVGPAAAHHQGVSWSSVVSAVSRVRAAVLSRACLVRHRSWQLSTGRSHCASYRGWSWRLPRPAARARKPAPSASSPTSPIPPSSRPATTSPAIPWTTAGRGGSARLS